MKKILLLIITAFFILNGVAQDYSITGIKRAFLTNINTIYSGDEVKGYYFFNFSERSDNKKWYYKLTILDADLNKLASKSIIVDKRTMFLGGTSHDDAILLKFYEPKSKMITYRVMGLDGSRLGMEKREPTKFERRWVAALNEESQLSPLGVANQGNIGFIDFVSKDKSAYEILGINNEGDEAWTYSVPEPKGVRVSSIMGASDEHTVLMETSTKSRMSNDMMFKLIILDNKGEETHSQSLEIDDKSHIPYSVNILESGDKIILSGEYYNTDRKEVKSESEGMFFWVMTPEGEMLKSSYANWEDDIKPLYEDGKKLLKNSLYFHDIKEMADGRIIAIAEEYKKQISAGGVALKALAAASGGSSAAGALEIKIGNIIIYTLDQDFTVKQVDVVEKNPNRINLGSEGAGLSNKHKLAKIIHARGGFDYRFIQNDNAREKLTIVYSDGEKEKGKLMKQPKINAFTYAVGSPKPTKSKIDMKEAKWRVDAARYFPSNGDKMISVQYNRKEKKIKVETVPLNSEE